MQELQLGFVNLTELADWFGVSKKYLANRRRDFLEKLKDYCEFENVYGGVDIKSIYKICYVKNRNYEKIKEEVPKEWSITTLDSCKRVSDAIYTRIHDELNIKDSTTYVYTVQARTELWGSPMPDKNIQGTRGSCQYVLCKEVNGHYEFLSPEEEKIKEELLKKWFGSKGDKTMLVHMMIENGELSREEAWDFYEKIMELPSLYKGFMDEFKRKTGVELRKGTMIVDVKDSAFETRKM